MPKRTTRKPDPPPAPAPVKTRGTPPPPLTPMKPVVEKIGEGPDNLKAREQAYKRRSGLR